MKKNKTNNDSLYFLGRTTQEELNENFDLVYDYFRLLSHKKKYKGDIKFIESLDEIFVYVKIN